MAKLSIWMKVIDVFFERRQPLFNAREVLHASCVPEPFDCSIEFDIMRW